MRQFLGRALRLGQSRGPSAATTCVTFKTPPAASLCAGIPQILFFWIYKIQSPSPCFGISRSIARNIERQRPYFNMFGRAKTKLSLIWIWKETWDSENNKETSLTSGVKWFSKKGERKFQKRIWDAALIWLIPLKIVFNVWRFKTALN